MARFMWFLESTCGELKYINGSAGRGHHKSWLSSAGAIFETGIDEFPYSTKGTVFLVGFEGKVYVKTNG